MRLGGVLYINLTDIVDIGLPTHLVTDIKTASRALPLVCATIFRNL
jgi:hypothetical protein